VKTGRSSAFSQIHIWRISHAVTNVKLTGQQTGT